MDRRQLLLGVGAAGLASFRAVAQPGPIAGPSGAQVPLSGPADRTGVAGPTNQPLALPASVLSKLSLALYSDAGVLDASGNPIANNVKVKTWTDTTSGNGFVGTQATVGTQPTWIAHAYASTPALRFFGASSLSVPDNVLLRPDSGEFRVFVVQRTGIAKLGFVLAKGNSASTLQGYSIITDYVFPNAISIVRCSNSGGAGRGSQTLNGIQQAVNLVELTLNGTTIIGTFNGIGGWTSGGEGPPSNTYSVPISNTDTLVIGASSTPTFGYADIFALLIFKGSLTTDEVTGIRRYLQIRYPPLAPPAVTYGNEVTVFANGTGYPFIRIPAIIACNDGTLLAFAEGRAANSDTGQIAVIMRRSTDNGTTWGTIQVVRSDGTNTCGNPAPMVDRTTGRVHLLTCWNNGADTEAQIIAGTGIGTRHVYYQFSDDSGVTWSDALDITATAKGATMRWYGTGPGSNQQLANGRLLFPCDHSDPAYVTGTYKSHVIYSDDNGATWNIGAIANLEGTNECALTQSLDGTVYLSMRNQTQNLRWQATSADNGATLTTPAQNVALTVPQVQCDVIAVGSVLVFCGPNNTGTTRTDETMRVSTDGGTSWPAATLIHSGPSQYSDMTVMATGQLGVLYEVGSVTSLVFGVANVAYPVA